MSEVLGMDKEKCRSEFPDQSEKYKATQERTTISVLLELALWKSRIERENIDRGIHTIEQRT